MINSFDFLGAQPAVPVGLAPTGATISHFRGRPEEWKTGMPAYGGLRNVDDHHARVDTAGRRPAYAQVVSMVFEALQQRQFQCPRGMQQEGNEHEYAGKQAAQVAH